MRLNECKSDVIDWRGKEIQGVIKGKTSGKSTAARCDDKMKRMRFSKTVEIPVKEEIPVVRSKGSVTVLWALGMQPWERRGMGFRECSEICSVSTHAVDVGVEVRVSFCMCIRSSSNIY